jgi:hypothetical protein
LTFILAFTCLLSQGQSFTNKGREFWVGYGHNDLFPGNAQDMVVYLSADQPANVTLSIPGTSWVKNYSIGANSVVVSDLIPKSGAEDCRLTNEGLFRKAVHIESNVPIVAYAHMYGLNSSGAAMLLPVETYGYTYSSINASQHYNKDCYSWFYVIAAENNTKIRITPSTQTKGLRPAKASFDVDLKKGEIYNVMGYNTASEYGSDLTGSKVSSIPGADGKCHPITMFSGSSRTYICAPDFDSGGDFLMQQVFPVTAWGARYLAHPSVERRHPDQLVLGGPPLEHRHRRRRPRRARGDGRRAGGDVEHEAPGRRQPEIASARQHGDGHPDRAAGAVEPRGGDREQRHHLEPRASEDAHARRHAGAHLR